MDHTCVETTGLTRYFDQFCAVDRMNLEVGNEIFGLLGPNGSGKTTTVLMLTTLLSPTHGSASVCGFDVIKQPRQVREQISYVPQDMAVDVRLTGRENVRLYADLYGTPRPKDRTDEVLEILDLTDRADEFVRTYSGGMRRRLELAQALVHDPKVLFLDEPTVGLDVAARRRIWEHIRSLKKHGMTIFVTTHYMDEADRNCDRVAVLDRGVIRRCDSPSALKSKIPYDIISATIAGSCPPMSLKTAEYIGQEGDELIFFAPNGETALDEIRARLNTEGVVITSLTVRRPTLDDVFLHLVENREDSERFNMSRFRNMLGKRR